MPEDFHDRLEAEVKKQIPLASVVDDPDLGTQLCYKKSAKKNLDGPTLIVHLEGAYVKLPPSNFFIPPCT